MKDSKRALMVAGALGLICAVVIQKPSEAVQAITQADSDKNLANYIESATSTLGLETTDSIGDLLEAINAPGNPTARQYRRVNLYGLVIDACSRVGMRTTASIYDLMIALRQGKGVRRGQEPDEDRSPDYGGGD